MWWLRNEIIDDVYAEGGDYKTYLEGIISPVLILQRSRRDKVRTRLCV